MPKFQMSRAMYIGNVILKFLLGIGVPMGTLQLLSHQGRKSGKIYVTPVALVKQKRTRWLVGAFGDVNWVKNVRADGHAKLKNGLRNKVFKVVELQPEEAVPVLKQFLNDYRAVPFFRPYFNVTRQSPNADFMEEARKHPVFLLME